MAILGRPLLLEQYRRCDDPDARVSSGHLARVSAGAVVDYPHGIKVETLVLAAHGDSVLLQTWAARSISSCTAPARPPSLSLLPPCYHAEREDQWGRKKKEQRYMDSRSTTLLRREQDKMAAALDRCFRDDDDGEEGERAAMEAQLCLLPRRTHFNAFSHDERTAASQRQWRREDDTLGAPKKPSSSGLTPMASPEEALASTLHEMPDLARDDMLQRAYNILGPGEEWLKFRSLYLALPIDLRKD
ncbi:hypothetical protein BRADI_1g56826v3 [Brachypodium distachyon]|uniref:Uncharacterized protein n=1 Tax=Brachypodium distachyon TaxID=15368 RepID=A0A2K2DRW4_BRADI|nr:hypothetical protein BRADI_1g56826v3 [Brachypodium distachyon]